MASDDTVEYQNRIYKLSPFVGTFLPVEKQTPSGAYQGAKYFSYKGKVLDELRKEKERVCHKSVTHPFFCVFLYILVES